MIVKGSGCRGLHREEAANWARGHGIMAVVENWKYDANDISARVLPDAKHVIALPKPNSRADNNAVSGTNNAVSPISPNTNQHRVYCRIPFIWNPEIYSAIASPISK